jgi:hypothetical protein
MLPAMSSAAIDYGQAGLPVRPDLPEAHRRAWAHVARPGSFLDGAQRVAVAREVRSAWKCALCRARADALSPEHVRGEHDTASDLSDAAVELIHRVTTDPGRLSRRWFDSLRAGGLDEGEYVEILGVLVTVVSIDQFCRGLGLPLHELPEPQPGAPSRRRPPGLVDGGAWVAMLDPRRVDAAERDLFPAGRTGNVIRALSLVPDEVRNLVQLSQAHYLRQEEMMDLARGRGALDRAQVELVAGRISALRECFY